MSTGLVGPRVSRSETVGQAIEAMIRDRALQPGEHLGTKKDLRGRFKVAMATFNEALRMLETRGVIELRPGPGGGVFVGQPPALIRFGHKMLSLSGESVSVADSLAVRNALEPHVIASAARHRTDADVAELRVLVRRMAESADPIGYLRANWALHRRIAEISPNMILRQIYLSLLDFAEEHVDSVDPVNGSDLPSPGAIEVHTTLIEAIASGDPAATATATTRHARLTDGEDSPAP
ncbi:FadR/GntR family transcriptional regulator [Actinomadura sp. LOL_016]|uniref:FadR/GntR family transcriptional regulator n=1 Tax=unclassified Actinomadura TaxID=2626254 RepID=UPI003A80A487